MKATCSQSRLETHLYAVLSSFTECFRIVITIATNDRMLTTCQAPGASLSVYTCIFIYDDYYGFYDYYLPSVHTSSSGAEFFSSIVFKTVFSTE